jgi:hypothetical protein
MPMQMYIISMKGQLTQESSRAVQHEVRNRGGLILMVTRTGPLVAIDDAQVPAVAAHPLVKFMGPVTLNPRGVAADRIQRIFAENLSKQLVFEASGGGSPPG